MSNALDLDGANPWRTQSSRVAYDNGRLRVREDEVTQPDGEPGTYSFLELPWPVVAIVPRRDGAEHDLISRHIPLADAIDAAMDGRIEHSMSVVGLLRAARRLGL